MPTYLCHGFRWPRTAIRTFVIAHDLDDAAPDWVVGTATAALILDQFHALFDFLPALADHQPSPVALLEEYDLAETVSPSRPYAYVADHVLRVDLGVSVAAEMAAYHAMADKRGRGWFERLRDELHAVDDTQWYVVVCADDERAFPQLHTSDDEQAVPETDESDDQRPVPGLREPDDDGCDAIAREEDVQDE